MKKKRYVPYVVSILLTLAVGGVSALITSAGMPSYEALIKPPLTPPSWIFPIVWNILYILMAVGMAMVWNADAEGRQLALGVYIAQLVVNCLWSWCFFMLQARFAAFMVLILLWILIWLMIACFRRAKPLAGFLQIPYLVWVTFAGYLNLAIYLLN